MSEYIPDVRTREKPRRTTKYSGDRQSAWKTSLSNDSKNDARSWKTNGHANWKDIRNVWER